MNARVTFKTNELTIRKTVADHNNCSDANLVLAIVAVIDAYDAAHRYKDYSIRQNLQEALSRGGI